MDGKIDQRLNAVPRLRAGRRGAERKMCKDKCAVVYVHGMGGSPAEAGHYQALFPERDVIGFAYHAQTPWEAKPEFAAFFARMKKKYRSIALIANSIGAYFAMSAGIGAMIEKAYFISPIVDMEKLICAMMAGAGVTEDELRKAKVIHTASGDVLSWEYLSYVRSHPLTWCVPTEILYGARDSLVVWETVSAFSAVHDARLTVMEEGEHWFHTEAQMRFLDRWILDGEASCDAGVNGEAAAENNNA